MARHDNKKAQKNKQSNTHPAKPSTGQPNNNTQVTQPCDERLRVTVNATLLEDTHLGSGLGSAGVDALISRDRHGRPVVWASHLEGVLRNASLRLFGEQKTEDFFGTAGGKRQSAIFTSLYTQQDTPTRIWRSSARTAFDNRAPKTETLRSMEYVPTATRFEGQIEVRQSDLPTLKRLLKEIDSLGSGRASGAGRITTTLTEPRITPRSVGEAKQRLILCLYSREPICITSTATPGNLLLSESFLPGRSILGAITRWLMDAGKMEEAKLLVNGSVSISDALPLPEEPKSLATTTILPAPLTLQHKKPAKSTGSFPWWANSGNFTERVDRFSDATKDEKLKRPDSDLFVYRASSQEPWTTFIPPLRVRLRNGRPGWHLEEPKEPELFAIEEIVEKTHFLCEIRGKQTKMAELATALLPVLNGSRWLRVGRGGAPVEVKAIEWIDPPQPTQITSNTVLTLTSDLLFRDEYLHWCMSVDAVDKDNRPMCPGWPGNITITRRMQEPTQIYGFNGTSGLWRMPAYGIRRGSVFLVEGAGVEELAKLASKGIWLGERTHEGFGRFRIDTTLPGITTHSDSAPNRATTAMAGFPDDIMETAARITHDWLKEHESLAKPDRDKERVPSLSQWFDFVAHLEQEGEEAIDQRLNPETTGQQSWANPEAKEILKKILTVENKSRVNHARFFVRWLRAEMKGDRR